MFVGTTLASLASGLAWSSQWCHLLEPWLFTGSSCPISSTTQDNLSTVSYNANVSVKKKVSNICSKDVIKMFHLIGLARKCTYVSICVVFKFNIE